MAGQIIPLDATGLANYSQVTALNGSDFILTFQWNSRDSHWRFSLADQDEVPIVSGVRVVADWNLTRRCVDARCPSGAIMAIDRSELGIDPGFADFGTRVELLYFTPEEIAAVA